MTEPGVLPDELSVLPSAAASGLLIHPHPAGVSLLGGGRGKEEREGTSVSFSQEKVNFWKQTWEETAGCHQLHDTQTGSWQEVSANPAYAELLVAVLRLKRESSLSPSADASVFSSHKIWIWEIWKALLQLLKRSYITYCLLLPTRSSE